MRTVCWAALFIGAYSASVITFSKANSELIIHEASDIFNTRIYETIYTITNIEKKEVLKKENFFFIYTYRHYINIGTVQPLTKFNNIATINL